MYENTFPGKRFKKTLEFIENMVLPPANVLDLGVRNPFSEIMEEHRYKVTNTGGEDLDIDFGGSELSMEAESGNDESLTDASSEAEASDALSQLADSLDSDAELEEDEFDFLSGNDEASTKLDLARAYIEMDDKDGARDILEEVVNEGNDDQKAQAKDLMAQL